MANLFLASVFAIFVAACLLADPAAAGDPEPAGLLAAVALRFVMAPGFSSWEEGFTDNRGFGEPDVVFDEPSGTCVMFRYGNFLDTCGELSLVPLIP